MHGLEQIKQYNTDATNARIYRDALEQALVAIADCNVIRAEEIIRGVLTDAEG